MKEVIQHYNKKINSSILNKLKLDIENYIVASVHREENVENKDYFLGIIFFKKYQNL